MAGQVNRGAWVSYREGDFDSVVIHSSEIKALRSAIGDRGEAKFVKHGQSLRDAIAGLTPGAEPRLPGEEPIPGMSGDPAVAPGAPVEPNESKPEAKPTRKRRDPEAAASS